MERAVASPRRPALPARGPAGCGMMATVSSIYEVPELYQLACAYRDVPADYLPPSGFIDFDEAL